MRIREFVTLISVSSFLFGTYSYASDGKGMPIPSEEKTSSFSAPIPGGDKKKVTLSTFVEIPTHTFLISTGAGRVDRRQIDQRVQYNPTFGPNLGVRGSYGQWGLTLSKRLSFLTAQEEVKYGKSDFDDWRVEYKFSENFGIETYYQNYHGFYTDLTGQEGLQTTVGSGEGVDTGPASQTESEIVKRDDISALNYGIRAQYIIPLMPLFRFFSSEQERKQMNWDFNLLTKVYYNRLSITGDKPLVPAASSNSFSPIANLREHWTNTLGLGAGLGVSVPLSNSVLFGFEALLGAGFQRQSNFYVDREDVKYTTAQELNAKLFLDWIGQRHGFRFDFYLDTFSSTVDEVNFDSSSLGVLVAYTYRGLSL